MLHSNILRHAKEGIPQIGNASFLLVSSYSTNPLRVHIFYYQMYQVVHLQRIHL